MVGTRILQSISARLAFGFGAVLVLLVALALLGQYSSRSVASKMGEVTGINAVKPAWPTPCSPA